jgi:hypothetical protein
VFQRQLYAKYRFLRLVQKLNLPFYILLQFASGAADEIATNLGHFCPSSFLASICRAVALALMAECLSLSDRDKLLYKCLG